MTIFCDRLNYMNHKHKEIAGRIFLGIIILTILAIIIIPKPQEKKPIHRYPTTTPQVRVTTHKVILTPKGFEPDVIKIKKGEVVIWTNNSGREASVNSADHPTHKLFPALNRGLFPDGLSVQARISRIGELRYHNHLKPEQTGKIIVIE